jgi:2'-5' RNA ligase
MRLFIAIPIPENVKKYIASVQDEFHKFPLRFVRPEQIHITIDFLGEIPDNKVEDIVQNLDKIRSERFSLRLTSLGSFPSKEKIRVVWIAIDKNDKFIGLQEEIRKTLNHKGKLMPHLTIARARELINNKEISDRINNFETIPQEFPVKEFILFRSEPTSQGYVHSIVKEFPWNK